ncbi:peptide-methionine (S)-S-oxide reductase MsrA [Chthonobacter albigriseus]|uniref:peptide-methionine (S)-S-oxide reductase MsrA n=1 Tax=Chthonobacter albigriseus TaxID=1683161 RepID=UPI0015EEB5D4|nr:peptide-methionine (S)-S-oxide reductase MsrA [Chthonobacter albigriseus]
MYLLNMLSKKLSIPSPAEALPGRDFELETADRHFVNGNPLKGPYPDGFGIAYVGLGCFWGAERKFWQTPGVWVTAVGYMGGHTPNATYQEVCTGLTGHNEVVKVVFDPSVITYEGILKVFFENHDPTQGMRQGNDTGTQYRSGIYVVDAAQKAVAEQAKARYGEALGKAGYKAITTEILDAPPFYYAETYHQQYLAKNPNGYCGIGGTGVSCPLPTGVTV